MSKPAKRDHKGLVSRLLETVEPLLFDAGYRIHPVYRYRGYGPSNRSYGYSYLGPQTGAHLPQVDLTYYPHNPSPHLNVTQYLWPHPPDPFPDNGPDFADAAKGIPFRILQFGGPKSLVWRMRQGFDVRFQRDGQRLQKKRQASA